LITTDGGRTGNKARLISKPSIPVFAYCKHSKTEGMEGLKMRLKEATIELWKIHTALLMECKMSSM